MSYLWYIYIAILFHWSFRTNRAHSVSRAIKQQGITRNILYNLVIQSNCQVTSRFAEHVMQMSLYLNCTTSYCFFSPFHCQFHFEGIYRPQVDMKHMQHFGNVSTFLVLLTVVKMSKCQAVQRIFCNNYVVEYVFGKNAQENSDKRATFSSFSLWTVAFFPWGTLFLHFKRLFLRKQETVVSFSLTVQGNVDDFTVSLYCHNITHVSMRDSLSADQ